MEGLYFQVYYPCITNSFSLTPVLLRTPLWTHCLCNLSCLPEKRSQNTQQEIIWTLPLLQLALILHQVETLLSREELLMKSTHVGSVVLVEAGLHDPKGGLCSLQKQGLSPYWKMKEKSFEVAMIIWTLFWEQAKNQKEETKYQSLVQRTEAEL